MKIHMYYEDETKISNTPSHRFNYAIHVLCIVANHKFKYKLTEELKSAIEFQKYFKACGQ